VNTDNLIGQLENILGIVLYMSLPPLIAAVAVGIVVGLIQAVTSIQDQSMPLTFKLLTIIFVLVVAGPALVTPLARETGIIFDNFAVMSR
jgi:type III secretion protein S